MDAFLPHDDFHVCVSECAPGSPLEMASPGERAVLVPGIVDVLDAMRAITAPTGDEPASWADVLVTPGHGDGRLADWQERLVAEADLSAAYEQAMQSLRELADLPEVATVNRTLVHGDLINRNVHVNDGAITGMFDWGCRRWGDHLYDLALLQFWAPWFPLLDMDAVLAESTGRWGGAPDSRRMLACLTHIGAEHLAYDAAIGEVAAGCEVLDRMLVLDLL